MKNLQKMFLFRYFFCGRDDVYAIRVPGKGYRPRRIPKYHLTNKLLVMHMRGLVMLGAYPLLRGDLTQWVVGDFDGTNGNAFDEAYKLKEALESYDIDTICNTSQSGKGVHVRVIFDKPIPAYLARGLMIALLEREKICSIKEGGAFDRFFPAQDELDPHNLKAIGNQIAMPLNKVAAEERGGCLLLDNEFEKIELGPHAWDHMELYKRVERLDIVDILKDLGRYDLLSEPEKKRKKYKSGKIDYSKLTAVDLSVIVGNCDFFSYVKREEITYDEWWILATILTCFDGRGGRRIFHALSFHDSRYNESVADKKYNDVLFKIKAPVKCSTLSKYGWTCPSMGADGECNKFRNDFGRGPRTPATISYFAGLVEARKA